VDSLAAKFLLTALLLAGNSLSVAGTLAANKRAPDFARTDLDGARIRLADYRGKVVLLSFWATWCAPCLEEMPRFVEWQKHYGAQGLQVLGVSMDDDDYPVRALDRKLHLNYPVVMGDEKLGALYGGVLGLPVTYLVDGKGMIRARFDGETNPLRIERRLTNLLSVHPRPSNER
jgi:peroxiredoxin